MEVRVQGLYCLTRSRDFGCASSEEQPHEALFLLLVAGFTGTKSSTVACLQDVWPMQNQALLEVLDGREEHLLSVRRFPCWTLPFRGWFSSPRPATEIQSRRPWGMTCTGSGTLPSVCQCR